MKNTEEPPPLKSEIHNFVSSKINEGLTPSKALRVMYDKYGEQNLHEMCVSLGIALGIERFDVLAYLGHWWFDKSSDLTDEQLDSHLIEAVNKSKNYKNA